jgi:hypothetical protein
LASFVDADEDDALLADDEDDEEEEEAADDATEVVCGEVAVEAGASVT